MKSDSDSLKLRDNVSVVRYAGSPRIRKMIDDSQFVEAFVHTQLAIEKILWDKIAGVLSGERGSKFRGTVDNWKGHTYTSELIKWAFFLGAIEHDDLVALSDFNDKRNRVVHRHGEWWSAKDHMEALEKGIRFIQKNGF